MNKESIKAIGICRAKIIVTKNGKKISVSDLGEDFIKSIQEKLNYRPPSEEYVQGNLVVNTGRSKLARLLGMRKTVTNDGYPVEASYIDRIQLGDCFEGGVNVKAQNLPSLADTGLVREIQNDSGISYGKFFLDPDEDILFPEAIARYPLNTTFPEMAPTQGDLSADGTFVDSDVNFTSVGTDPLGVIKIDQVTFESIQLNNPIILGVKEVVDENTLMLHNPSGFSGNNLSYRIDVPGTQVLFTKYVDGNNFSTDNGFPSPGAVVVHEAGLLFNDETLFNRVVFRPDDLEIGIILMAEQANGVKISVRFEWLVSF